MVPGNALVFPLEPGEDIRGLRASPVGVVEGNDKHRKVHDMTFGGSNETGGSGSVNARKSGVKSPHPNSWR